eukprot:TRINITY_DN8193_c0_g1_i1.p1 TRINITY_DN8193_c0_g1~~TRINITY_DN8193_c0_g1_i1.p1  ORF type:complete len:113 (-),score=15.03 TRINITY_DN8193_c0_g1_i1:36-374(-)
MAISQLEEWASTKHSTLLPNIRLQFEYLTEIANVLVIDKSILLSESLVTELFTKLNAVQINQLVQCFEPDEYAPEEVYSLIKQTVSGYAEKSPESSLVTLDPNHFVLVSNSS